MLTVLYKLLKKDMASSSTAPLDPLPSTTPVVMRRSFTLPSKKPVSLAAFPRTPDASQVEMLFEHRNGKIVSFTTPSSLLRTSYNSPRESQDVSNEAVGMFPWTSSTERTLAAGE